MRTRTRADYSQLLASRRRRNGVLPKSLSATSLYHGDFSSLSRLISSSRLFLPVVFTDRDVEVAAVALEGSGAAPQAPALHFRLLLPPAAQL